MSISLVLFYSLAIFIYFLSIFLFPYSLSISFSTLCSLSIFFYICFLSFLYSVCFWQNSAYHIIHRSLTELNLVMHKSFYIVVVINPIRPRGVLFAIPLSILMANVFGWAVQFQNLMVFQVEDIYITYWSQISCLLSKFFKCLHFSNILS